MSLTEEEYNDRKDPEHWSEREWTKEIGYILTDKFPYLRKRIFSIFGEHKDLFQTSLLEVLASSQNEERENLFEKVMNVLSIQDPLKDRIFKFLTDVTMKNEKEDLFTTLDKVKETSINWLAKGYIAYGYCTLVVGKAEQGKSTFLADLLANLSKGSEVFGNNVEEQKVLYISAEETSSNIFKPKMKQAGCIEKNVHCLSGTELPDFPQSIEYVLTYVYENDIKVIVIDPILSMMNGDMMKETDVRIVMHSLYALAQTLNCAVIVVSHTGKTRYVDPIHDALGSQGFTATVRSVLYIAQDKETEKRYCSVAKTNLVAKKNNWEFEFISVPNSDVASVIHHGSTEVIAYKLNTSKDNMQEMWEQDIYEELFNRKEWESKAMREFFTNHEFATSSMRTFEEARANLVKQGKIQRRKASDRKVYYSVAREEQV